MKQYTKKDFENIYSEIRACGTVAEHLAENLENIPFADLRGRLENLRDLLAETLEKYQEKATNFETITREKKGLKMENKKQYVYLVRQTQLADDYNKTTIAVFDSKEQAEKLAHALNKEYGTGVVFDDDWNFVEWTCELDDIHYYDVDCQELNPDMVKK